jgi:hypothetical protein
MERTVSNDGPEFSKLTQREYEQDKASIWRELNRIVAILEGPPSPGLRDYVNNFITTFNAVEKTRHEENQQKLADISRKMGQRSFWVGVAGVGVAIMAIVISVVGIMVGIWLHTHANVDLPKLFADPQGMVVSSEEKSPEISGGVWPH